MVERHHVLGAKCCTWIGALAEDGQGTGFTFAFSCLKALLEGDQSRFKVSLVGRDGRYDFIRNGIASDAPSLRGLTLDQAASLLRRTRADPLPGDAA